MNHFIGKSRKPQITDDSISQYMRDTAKFDVLSMDEERALFERLATGDEDARDEIVKANLRLVIKVAKPYFSFGMSKLDIVQEGNIGLIKATYKFDVSRGIRFATFATFCIRKAISRALSEQGYMVRFPANSIYDIIRIYNVKAQLEQRLGRDATFDEISEATHIPTDRLTEMLNAAKGHLSYNIPINNEGIESYIDSLDSFTNAYSAVYKRSLSKALDNVLSVLSEREADILRLRHGYYGECRTLREIGELYNLSRERIRQIELMAMQKLRRSKYIGQLRYYLEEV